LLGGEAAANAHVVTRQQQGQNKAQNSNEINDPNSETNMEVEKVRWETSTPLTTEIRLKIPRNRYLDTGLSADVKKPAKHMPWNVRAPGKETY
jgi:hypothetical protein